MNTVLEDSKFTVVSIDMAWCNLSVECPSNWWMFSRWGNGRMCSTNRCHKVQSKNAVKMVENPFCFNKLQLSFCLNRATVIKGFLMWIKLLINPGTPCISCWMHLPAKLTATIRWERSAGLFGLALEILNVRWTGFPDCMCKNSANSNRSAASGIAKDFVDQGSSKLCLWAEHRGTCQDFDTCQSI